jgi:hypothetical protein
MLKKMTQLLRAFGFLRLSLVALVAIDMLARPMPGSTPDYESPHVIVDMIVSALAPILFMLLLLDAIMTLVYMSSMPAERKLGYRLILVTNLALAVIFLVYWWPYFKALI